MGHIVPCLMEKTSFPNMDAPIDKRNLFLLSGRANFPIAEYHRQSPSHQCVKSVQIRSTECGKIRTINYSVFGHFSRSDTFSVRVKPIQNPIIKNNPWLEILLHLKQCCFLIFVIQDLAILENCTRM